MNQKQLFATFLNDAADNTVPDTVAPDLQDELPEEQLLAGFHRAIERLGAPYTDRAEAAEVALDATASVIAGVFWVRWLGTPAHELGKQGYRAEALVLLTAIAESGADVGAVRAWYRDRSRLWDDPVYDRSGFVEGALERISELRDLAAERPAGVLFATDED